MCFKLKGYNMSDVVTKIVFKVQDIDTVCPVFIFLCLLFKLCNHCLKDSDNTAALNMHWIRAGLNPSVACCVLGGSV